VTTGRGREKSGEIKESREKDVRKLLGIPGIH
jgi:hypothetical protein